MNSLSTYLNLQFYGRASEVEMAVIRPFLGLHYDVRSLTPLTGNAMIFVAGKYSKLSSRCADGEGF